jgi:NAD(P)-dependent dehydrogenase (short-subunit alcohol dehydrogenase family)
MHWRLTSGERGRMADFSERVIGVTGAGSGIGAEVVRQLTTAGAIVAALDLDRAGLDRTVAASDGRARALVCDVTDEDQVADAFASAAGDFGKLDGLVNAAGIVISAPFLEFTYEQWERTFRVNTWGTYLTIKHAVPHLRRAGGGSIVNFSSSGGKLSNPYTAPYAASKAAIVSLTRSAAGELAPEIRVNSVVPGIIDTPMWEQLGRDFTAMNVPITMEGRAAAAPLGRPGRPDDVAAAVLFLLSDDARFITGEDLNVSGGQVMF